MSDAEEAFLIWLPSGTVLPFIVSRLTGSDTRGAAIEAAIFAVLGLLIYPTALALMVARFIQIGNVAPLFVGGYLLAIVTLLIIRRRAAGPRRVRRGSSRR